MRLFLIHLIKFLIGIFPTIIMFDILIKLFPYTGLGRIVVLPAIFLINSAFIIVAILLTNKMNHRWNKLIWSSIVCFTVVVSIAFYPQEFSPHVVKQVLNGVSEIQNYNRITLDDLKLENSTVDTINPREKYVVALYKFRDEIPLDGSYHIYDKESSYSDSAVRSVQNIPDKLEGYHKVMWWYLVRFH